MKTIDNPDIVTAIFEKNTKENRIARVENMIQKKVGAKVKFLLDKAFELADGIYTIDERDPLKVRYYRKPPNLEAIIYLIDRLIGKPVAKSENRNIEEKKGVQAVQSIILQLAGNNITVNGNNRKSIPDVTVSNDDVRPGEDTLQE